MVAVTTTLKVVVAPYTLKSVGDASQSSVTSVHELITRTPMLKALRDSGDAETRITYKIQITS